MSFPRIDGREWTRKGSSFRRGPDTVERTHVVQPRECMSRIAHRFAFRSPDTLWKHECNRSLRDGGRSPDVLWPGDRVNILARDDRFDEAETNRRHHFVVKTAARWLRLVLHDVFRRPLASTAYVLALRGEKPIARTTDESGLLEEIIPPSATEATITAGDYVWQVVIADVLPVDDVPDEGREGVLRRLRNLGCPAARPGTERSLDAASSLDEGTSLDATHEPEVFDADVFMHQLRVGWAASGQIDEPTRERVIDEYGV